MSRTGSIKVRPFDIGACTASIKKIVQLGCQAYPEIFIRRGYLKHHTDAGDLRDSLAPLIGEFLGGFETITGTTSPLRLRSIRSRT